MKYDLAECQDVKIFSGLLLIIGDFRTFSTKFRQISQRFGRFLQISTDFIGFIGIFQVEEVFVGFPGFSKDFRISIGFLT